MFASGERAVAARAQSGDRNPVSRTDWKVWEDNDLETIYRINKLAPKFSACAKLTRAVEIGQCERKPLGTLGKLVNRHSSVIRKIAARTRPGLCRTAAYRYASSLNANLAANVLVNRRLLANDVTGANAALKAAARTKRSEQKSRASSHTLCAP